MIYSPWQRLRCKREDEASKWPNTHIEEINMQNLTSHSLRRTLGFGNKRPRKGGLVVFGKQQQPRSLSNLLRIYGDNLWSFLMITKDTRHLTRTTFRTHPLFQFNSQPHGKQKLPVFSLRNPNPITVIHTNLLRGNERKRERIGAKDKSINQVEAMVSVCRVLRTTSVCLLVLVEEIV